MARIWIYGFEIKQVQAFILAGGRLRDAIGASLFTDALIAPPDQAGATAWFDRFLAQNGMPVLADGLTPDPVHARYLRRAASGIHLACLHPQAEQVLSAQRDLWRRTLYALVPELNFIDALASGTTLIEAHKALKRVLIEAANHPGPKPLFLTPAMAIAPRTGRPLALDGIAADAQGDSLDHGSLLRRQFYSASRALLWRFQADAEPKDWPYDLTDMFAKDDENRQIAVVHADGNRFGQMLQQLSRKWDAGVSADAEGFSPQEEAYAEFCIDIDRTIGGATRAALRQATEEVIKPRKEGAARYPARPLMQGGDDVLIITRANLAIDWADCYLAAFQREATSGFRSLYEKSGQEMPFRSVSASAGIAVTGESHPFTHGHELAEELAAFAKKQGQAASDGETLPLMAFHRVTQSLSMDYESMRKQFLCNRRGACSTLNPYLPSGHVPGGDAVDRSPRLPNVGALRAAASALASGGIGHGPLREMLAGALDDTGDFRASLRRWEKIARKQDPAAFDAYCRQVENLVGTACLSDHAGDHFLTDLELLRSVGKRFAGSEADGAPGVEEPV